MPGIDKYYGKDTTVRVIQPGWHGQGNTVKGRDGWGAVFMHERDTHPI